MENQKYMIGAVQQTKLLELGLDIKDAYCKAQSKMIIFST